MKKEVIATSKAPAAIGTYSQAVRIGDTVYFSGQIALSPTDMTIVAGDFKTKTRQVFKNLSAVAQAAGGNLSQIVKMTVYLTDVKHYADLNEVMKEFFEPPYPARALVGIAELPKEATIEIDAIMVLK